MHRVQMILAACLVATPSLANEETEISITDAPAELLDVARETAPGVEFTRVSIEEEVSGKVYEFEAVDYAGRHIEIDVLEDGTLEEIEMEISESEIPSAVRETLETTIPGFEPDYIELSVRQNGADFVYEFQGEYEGAQIDIEIAEDGKLLVISDGALI